MEAETQPALFGLDPTRVERYRITPAANIDAICRELAGNGGAVDVYVEDYGDLAVVSCSGHGFVFDLGDWDMWSGGPIVCMVTNVACRR
ncbi:MAG: hypothetical protein OXK76_18000 [Gammaproteobacteria bacterium]|nr:hypothetical protein [Gammaproteobacteria bacterium]